ncbi:MAG: cbpA [Herminiimonas sp.]|nr:cbpA [Herminiimonas sp.]
MKSKDYYQAPGAERTATDADIKKACRRLVRKYHPDISKDPEGEEKSREPAEACAALKDPGKKEEYDRLGSRNFSPRCPFGFAFS